jgi:Ca-activated chloride channel family protein
MPVFANQDTTDTTVGLRQNEIGVPVYIRSHRVNVEITDQIARTTIEQVFVNEGAFAAEGTYVFPLPRGVTISDLKMIIDGQEIQARVLERDEARAIYDEIVRQLRDPALLEYIGTDAIQANIFPIPAGDERTLQIEYTQLLTVDNGLVNYVYPLRTRHISPLPVGELSVRVSVESNDLISNIYSPTHNIAIDRKSETSFVAGFETYNTKEASDFSLYYGIASDEINVNLLSYRESATEDGFFVALIAPPVEVDEDRIIPKDVIIVLDMSGSMYGEKWEQAQEAAKYVLDNLNESDHFNVVLFSTGTNVFSREMQPPSEVSEAKAWIDSVEAVGGTNIDSALQDAFSLASGERQAVILFMTDGLATEGITETSEILKNVEANAKSNMRIFTFGVGDDVDTFLLDQISQSYSGTSAYVRPEEDITEEVSALYNKISAPVLTDLVLDVTGVDIYDVYPNNIPDLFIGTQLVVVGRYRGDTSNGTIRLSGKLENETMTFVYDELPFRANAGGEDLIARLWATRKIGEMLNSIRLNGENQELVDSIVRLSIRYGIITPYTSFLITEDDILSQQGRDRAFEEASQATSSLDDEVSGANAVEAAEAARGFSDSDVAAAPPASVPLEGGDFAPQDGQTGAAVEPIRIVGDRTFIYRNGVWVDTTYNPDEMTPEEIVFLSEAYFDLLDQDERVAEFYALGDQVIFVLDGQAYAIVLETTTE